jgi:hypothetical protein
LGRFGGVGVVGGGWGRTGVGVARGYLSPGLPLGFGGLRAAQACRMRAWTAVGGCRERRAVCARVRGVSRVPAPPTQPV